MKITIELKECGRGCPIQEHAKQLLKELEDVSMTIKNYRDSIKRMYIE